MFFFVLRVTNLLPQPQVTVASTYSGWMSAFMEVLSWGPKSFEWWKRIIVQGPPREEQARSSTPYRNPAPEFPPQRHGCERRDATASAAGRSVSATGGTWG